LKSSGIVECAKNLFQRINNFICVFGEYVKSVLSFSENTQNVVNHFQRMQQKALSVHRDYGGFRVVLLLQSCLEYATLF
jgi:hypothetical protein